MNKNFYVDYCLKSVTVEDSAVSSNLLVTFPESVRAKSVKDLQLGVMPSHRALA